MHRRPILKHLLSGLLGLILASAFLAALSTSSGSPLESASSLPSSVKANPQPVPANPEPEDAADQTASSSRSQPGDLSQEPTTNSSPSTSNEGARTATTTTPTSTNSEGEPETHNSIKPEQPSSPSETNQPSPDPTRPGVPLPIETFDNVGGPLSDFYASLQERCGDAPASECLYVTVQIAGDDVFPEDCTVEHIEYRPPNSLPSEVGDHLEPGTTVIVSATCPSTAVTAFPGGTLTAYRLAQQETLVACEFDPSFTCIYFEEQLNGDATNPDACTVDVTYTHGAGEATRQKNGQTYVRRDATAHASVNCPLGDVTT